MGRIVFLHAADLHLDSPYSGLKMLPAAILEKVRESAFQSFQGMIDAAIRHEADFILLAGDLYDGENRSLRTQVRFRSEMERLKKNGISAYIIHGNHDHLGGSWIQVEYPENVHVFAGNTEMKIHIAKDRTAVSIYGCSYSKRHVPEKIVDTYQKIQGADYHIGMLHGNLEGSSGHSPYAPFSLTNLEEKDFDYWALGHIHKRMVISKNPLAIYPGSVQGRNRKETGKKGCYLIRMEGEARSYSFIETSHLNWESAKVYIGEDDNFDSLLKSCRALIEEKRSSGRNVLLDLVLEPTCSAAEIMLKDEIVTGLTDILQEGEEDMQPFIWTAGIQVKETQRADSLSLNSPFLAELMKSEPDEDDFEKALEQLFKHRHARRYLEYPDKEERQNLLEDSRRLLQQILYST
ncbi:metallophosphoesterase family protein [Peribacillus sp. B-H-3]|uniref:metallophosphoesterase family protein n=1 Tax=Peribacillus sp. B-H-3 TaxID=3400420 RepID=UPI003B026085